MKLDGLLSPNSHSADERFMAEFDAYFSGGRITEPLRQRLARTITLQGYFELTRLIELGQLEGSIRDDIKAELLNVTVINATRALQQRLILRGSALIEATQEDLQEMNRVHIQLLSDGLCPANKKKKPENRE